MWAAMSVSALALMLMLMLVSPARGGITCPPVDEDSPDLTLEEIYYYSDLVVMGKVIERHPLKDRGPAAYTAEMEVYCVYKGKEVQSHINITDAGKVPDKCFETVFEVGVPYMTYLKKHDNGRLTPAYPQHPEGYKDEMVLVCGVNITLPIGLSELPKGVKCENKQDYDYDDDYYYSDENGKENSTCFSFHPKGDPTYETAKTKDKDVKDDNGNGNEPVRMSLLLLALLHVSVLVFS